MKGDILYSRVGAKFEEAGVVEHDFDFSVYVSLTLIRPIAEKINNYFFKYYLNSPIVKGLAKKSISSSGVPNLNVNDVREFPVKYPSLAMQKQIVNQIETIHLPAEARLAGGVEKITAARCIPGGTMNEAETRAEHIDPALREAGWGIVEGSRIRREYPTLHRVALKAWGDAARR